MEDPALPGRESSMQRQELALLVNQIAQSITGTLELARVFELTVEKTRAFLGADAASLLLLDDGTGELYFDTVSGGPGEEAVHRIRLAPGEGVAGWVAQSGEPVLVRDVEGDPRFSWAAGSATRYGRASVVSAPLIAAGRVLGVLEAVGPPGRSGFDEAALEALCWLAPHVAVAVKNSRDTAELIRSRLDLARTNRELERRVQERTAQIARAKREWELTFDSIQDPIFLLEGTTVRRANLAFARLVGLPIAAVIGRSCDALLGAGQGSAACALAKRTGRGEAVIHGRRFEIASFAFPAGQAGDVAQVVSFRDVTEARVMEQKLRESERLASVGQLASGAAHEINNPLGFLKSNLGTLRAYFEDLQRAVERLELIEERVRRGELEQVRRLAADGLVPPDARAALEDVPVALAESLEGVSRVARIVQALKALTRDASRSTAREQLPALLDRAAIRAELAPGQLVLTHRTARELEVEPNQFELALANILRNARQASGPGATIHVETAEQDGLVTIAIVDSGCGMAPEVRARSFDPFFTTRETGSGVGLGLTSAWGIVKRHGGQIEIESQPGRGTTVRVTVPAAPIRG